MTRKMLLLWGCLSLAACAPFSSSQRETAEMASGLAFKSSLSVLLDHRSELALTPEQVGRFEAMDFTLREKNVPLQHELDSLKAQRKGGWGIGRSGPPDVDQERLERRERLERIESRLRAMQDNDSRAYVEAELLLTEEQKPRARELFSQEREKLLKQLEDMHQRIRRGDY